MDESNDKKKPVRDKRKLIPIAGILSSAVSETNPSKPPEGAVLAALASKHDVTLVVNNLRHVSREIKLFGQLKRHDSVERIALEVLQENFCTWMEVLMRQEGISMEKAIGLINLPQEKEPETENAKRKKGVVAEAIVMDTVPQPLRKENKSDKEKGKVIVEAIRGARDDTINNLLEDQEDQ